MSVFNHTPTLVLNIERCFDCGSFWALEQGKRGQCPHCAGDRISRVVGEQNKLERRLNAQKAATARMRARRRR